MDRRIVATLLFALVTGAVGCGPETPAGWSEPRQIRGPIEAGGAAVYLDTGRELVHVLEPASADGSLHLATTALRTGPDPMDVATAEGGDRVFVLDGDRNLRLFQRSSNSWDRGDLQLDHRYNRLTLHSGGDFLVLSSSSRSSDCPDCDPRAFGVVDLRGGVPTRAHEVELSVPPARLAMAGGSDADGRARWIAAGNDEQVSLLDLAALTDDSRDGALREEPMPLRPTSPADFVLVDLPEAGLRVLTLHPRDSTFRLTDPESGDSTSFSLPIEGPASDLIVDDSGPTRVLAWSDGASEVALLDPAALARTDAGDAPDESIETFALSEPPTSLFLDGSAGVPRAVATHGPPSGGLSLLDLRDDADPVRRLDAPPLADVRIAGNTALGVPTDVPNLARLPLDGGEPSPLPLPSSGEALTYDASDGLVLVDHGHPEGELSVVDVRTGADQPEPPDHVKVFEGVFVRDLFQTTFAD